MSADVAELRRLAAQARGLADELRATAHGLRDAQNVEFVSKAADRYREALRGEIRRAESSAHELDDASHALLEHAREVEERLAQIERLERWFGDRLRDAQRVLGAAANEGRDTLDAAQVEAQRIVEAARRAPASSSPQWLEFANSMRR